MNDVLLESRLRRVARRFQWVRVWRVLSVCWASAASVVKASNTCVGSRRGTVSTWS